MAEKRVTLLSQFIKCATQYALKEGPSNPGGNEIEWEPSHFGLVMMLNVREIWILTLPVQNSWHSIFNQG